MENPYECLANAIILQAVKDYRAAKRKLKHDPKNKDVKLMIEDCEKFFCSKRFEAFSSVDGEMILVKLKEEEVS